MTWRLLANRFVAHRHEITTVLALVADRVRSAEPAGVVEGTAERLIVGGG